MATIPTMVVDRGDGQRVIINVADYDPQAMRPWGEPAPAPPDADLPPPARRGRPAKGKG